MRRLWSGSALAHAGVALCPAAFGGAHARFVHTEIVRDLMPDGVLNHARQVLAVARQALMRALIDDDLIGYGKRFEDAAIRERPAAVEAKESGPGRLGFHHQRDVMHAAAEAARDVGESFLDQAVELFRADMDHVSIFARADG